VSENRLEKDILFLLEPNFIDPAFPGRVFYCWECALVEGVLFSIPALLDRVEVRRVRWPKPRTTVVQLAGPENQSMPMLVLATGRSSNFGTEVFEERTLIAGQTKILAAFSELYGAAAPHP
jgi:hypothetical protein